MRLTRRSLLTGAGSLVVAYPLRGAALEAQVIEGPAFGASWRAVVQTDIDPGALHAALEEVVASIDATMSPFRADSEIAQFNESDTIDWFTLSSETWKVVAHALDMAQATAGAFDPTVGGMVGQFGFGPILRRSEGDHTAIELRPGSVRKALPNLSLDLCGIAKGYALDRMVAKIEAFGVQDFMVEVGGEVSARGYHPSGRAWRIGIEGTEPGAVEVQCAVALVGEALATSGDRVNSYVSGGRRYSHLIDPHLRAPADPALASVSVLAPTAMRADALATALFAMGHERGPDFARVNDLPALFLVRGTTSMREIETGGFNARVLK